MSEPNTLSVLRRKALAGQERQKARAMTAVRAIRVSLVKAAEDEIETAIGVIGMTEVKARAKDLVPEIPEESMMILLDTPGRGGAAAVVDAALASAVVQQQTMGRVSELRDGEVPRKTTRTESALVAPWLDRTFKMAETLPDSPDDTRLLKGIRYGAFMAEKRLLEMALGAPEYLHMAIVVDIAGGVRQGTIDLFLPYSDQPIIADEIDLAEDVSGPQTLEDVVMPLEAPLQAALCRLRIPLSELSELKIGDAIPLPEGVLKQSEILTLSGRKIAAGKLGQVGGMRAIKLQPEGQSGAFPQRRDFDSPVGVPHMIDAVDPRDTGGGFAPGGTPGFESNILSEPGGAMPPLDGALTDLPDMPDDLPGLPDMSDDLPDLPDIPSGDLPDLPDISGGGDLPDLPDLPGLPTLP
ncbi:MAG: FliM/FliN family flagellar motor switch protein [Paracoccaceae bacterium]